MDADRTRQDILTAARLLGLSPDAVRKRLARGTLTGGKGPDGRWWVDLDNDVQETGPQPVTDRNGDSPTADALQLTLDAVRSELDTVRSQLDAKDHQISELLTVVRQAQAMLPAPKVEGRHWWRLWRR